MSERTTRALTALHARLGDDAKREAYWAALSRFLRFELTKAEFDRLALAAIGPNVALHNAVILALVADAQLEKAGEPAPAAPPGLFVFGMPPSHSNGSGGSSSRAAADALGSSSGGPPPLAREPSAAAGPKLMLKIRPDGKGGLGASAERPEMVVDQAEEAQLNALYERLLERAKQHGLTDVQPEAVSFMQRAVKSVSNRLLVASAAARSEGGTPADPDARALTAEDVHDAIRMPVTAPWMAPPCQRVSQTIGAFRPVS
jgi:hypothetical protein